MNRARQGILAALVIAVGACGAVPTTGPGGSSATGASGPAEDDLRAFRDGLGAVVVPASGDVDLARDRLLTAVDLGGALGDGAATILQLAADAETAAYAKLPEVAPPTSRTAPAAPDVGAAVTVAWLSAVPIPPAAPPPGTELMLLLPGTLEAVGRPGAGTVHRGPDSATASTASDGMTATSTMTTTVDAVVAGSAVTVTIVREVHSTVVDASGAVLLDSTNRYTIVGRMDVCPTGAGVSVAKLEQSITVDATTHAGALGRVGTHSTGSVTSASDFRGQVDDSARLGGVTQDYSYDEQWTRTAAAEGGPEAKREGTIEVAFTGIGAGAPAERGFTVNLGDFTAAQGTVETSGDATQDMVTSTALSAAWDFATMDQAYVAAQKLWRNSRCVTVKVPQYNAESQLEVSLQGSPAHTEEVDPDSVTPFDAALGHRFGQAVKATIEANLAGKEKLTPSSIATPPGTLTYTAPGEEGQTATVRMTSTSKQGVGILVIEFDTGRIYQVAATSTWTGAGLKHVATIDKARLTPTDAPGQYEGTATVTWVIEEVSAEPGCAKHSTTFSSKADLAGKLDDSGKLTVDVTYGVAEGVWRTYFDCTIESSRQVLSFTPAPLKFTVPVAGGSSTRPQMLIDTYASVLNSAGSVDVVVSPATQP